MDEHARSSTPNMPNTTGADDTTDDTTDDTGRRLDLALRLLASQSGAEGGAIQLLPGQAPADLPLTLPLPADARLVGSMIRGQAQEPPGVTILVDAPQAPERIAQFYIERLEALGWRPQIFPHTRGGFVMTQPGGFTHLRFTDGASEYTLVVTLQPGAAQGETALQVIVRKEGSPNWQRRSMGPDQIRSVEAYIPPLMPPPGASQHGGGGGGGMGRWHTMARLETALPVVEVIAHYDMQLARGGWQRHDGGSSGPVGWSAWSFTDTTGAPWRGVMLALNSPDRPRHYLLLVEIEAEGQHGEQGGGSTYSSLSSSMSSFGPMRG